MFSKAGLTCGGPPVRVQPAEGCRGRAGSWPETSSEQVTPPTGAGTDHDRIKYGHTDTNGQNMY